MVYLNIDQGYGHSDCSSERHVITGWRAQCCERREKERENMAAPECEREARKRRERRDSGCAHERKERRPHSEERIPPPPPPPPLHDFNRLESERRAERLSRARRPQLGKRRRPTSRTSRPPKENDCNDEAVTPPHFDYVHQLKPEVGDEVELPSVRHEEAEHKRRDERSQPPRRAQPSPERRLEKLNKKISVLKKNIAKYENEFEAQNGYSITPDERLTNGQLTRMYETLRKLQAEKKCMKTDPVEYALKIQAAKQQKERDDKLDAALKSDKPMADIVLDIEEWVEASRAAAGRGSERGAAALAAEKWCVQRALLRLEAARGRPPAHSAERGAARHLYERYRSVKRALAGLRPDAVNAELATIHEHEAMLFNTSVDSSSDSQDKPSDSSQETVETSGSSPPGAEESPASSAPSADDAHNEGLHCLPLEELTRALSEAKMLKCILRRNIKEYEVNFEIQNSRKVQRDDKKGYEEEYHRYKSIKARIKLINALINKQKKKD
ncbi:protein FAM13A-like isoform X2 [Aricia agestis]|uniref:protein FAM13A-like isoform X2 n=1 Tax=Aricia agestis TaxID=91739 RepID=UPI001C20BBE6|nr:protein FAM13A-like isoform X2 [Aricia agestis]